MTQEDRLESKSAEEIIVEFGLEPLLGEGGYFAHLQTNKEGNSIYFLLKDGDFSAWHRLKERETWVVVAGDPLELHLFNELENSYVSRQLKRSPGHLSYSVEPGVWMAATTRGRWSLVLCYLAPAFSGMELASSDLVHSWRAVNPAIPELVHE